MLSNMNVNSSKIIHHIKGRHSFVVPPSLHGNSIWCVASTPVHLMFVTEQLPQILMHHIRSNLPDIKARITQQLQKYSAELQSLGGPLGDGNAGNIVLSVITEFTSEFRTMIDGNTNDLSVNELSGGARISFVFHELFNNGIRSIDPFDQVQDGDIRILLYNSSVTCQFVDRCSNAHACTRVLRRLSSSAQRRSKSLSRNRSNAWRSPVSSAVNSYTTSSSVFSVSCWGRL
jgi:Dynamin central region